MKETFGRSVRLFLVDGKSTGMMTAEIMNWTGHVLTGPRSQLPRIISRTAVHRLVQQSRGEAFTGALAEDPYPLAPSSQNPP